MKIGYVVKYFHPIVGGAENYMLHLALEAAADGHDVHIFTGNRKGKQRIEKLEEEFKGLKIHRSKFWFDFTHYLYFNPTLLSKLIKTDLDIIHVSGFGHIWQDFVLIIKKLFSKETKFINTPHGPFMALGKYSIFAKFLRSIYTAIQKIFLNWLYEAILQDNTFQWQWIVQYGIDKSKIKLVSVGIEEEVINRKISSDEISRFRKKYNLEDKFVISSLGRISEYKGIQHVVEILPELVKMRPDITFLIMGRDEGYARRLKAEGERQKVLDNMRFILDISEEEKYVALELSDIFVFSSEWEAFGIVMLEAMARGNAIISTKTEGGQYLVIQDINGFLYDYGDTSQLLDSFRKLLDDSELVVKMQKSNLKKVRSFLWEETYKNQYQKVLDSILNEKL
jgi:glycosyltransferase involved in cell wall biosynthesis